ncbi:sensor histidine kinase [Cohnella pontilimi]|uniref:Sensor histidine kinase n=1 Tax=Cohnella pontilimi TaxID=2564100 RepID=A0A4U0FGQ7_9BACL|nr:sensor histidine kinase [Cohnella pontilimi]TJY44088.1 sensor histidine kinase [Cohnella pontilimi]
MVRYRLNIFNKILIMVLLLLIPILLLYGISNRTANQVIREEIESSNLNRLSFFLYQMDSAIGNLSMFPVILSLDPHIREFVDREGGSAAETLKAESRIAEKFGLQSVSSSWSNDLTVFIPSSHKVISTNIFLHGTGRQGSWSDPIHTAWSYEKDSSRGDTVGSFIREIGVPSKVRTFADADAVYQVRFPVQNISNLLDVSKKDKQSDPFLYHLGYEPILNSTSEPHTVNKIRERLSGEALSDSGQQRMVIENQEILVSYVKSRQLGWYLVDYVPEQRILSPIAKTSNLFYGSIALLLAMGVFASFLLYRHVQIPIKNIIRGVQRMKRGDLSARIDYRAKNEFQYLIQRFNEMAGQIQQLVEVVYAERISSREAALKQLQSQINPHFLYNSLFFMINSAKVEDWDSVIAMGENLAEYYRYTTRVENQTVRLKDEIELIENYLSIQTMRMVRLEYEISVPEEMWEERVPRLILQPIVENAVLHGIEFRLDGGKITVTGEQDGELNRIIVEDNGVGMSEEALAHLRAKLTEPMSEEIGCGVWNVHQRLSYQFGEASGLTFEHVPGGGLRVILNWTRSSGASGAGSPGEGGNNGTTDDRG